MPDIIQQLLNPGLNPLWSSKVQQGTYHREICVDAVSAWRRSPSFCDWVTGPSVLQPLVYRTAQILVVATDRVLAAPVNYFAALTGLKTATIGLLYGVAKSGLGGYQDISVIATAAQTGAAFGFQGVRSLYTFGLRLSLFCCSLLAVGIGLPMNLIHCFVRRTVPPQSERAEDFEPMRFSEVKDFLRGLEGQGGVIASISSIEVTPGEAVHTWRFSGDIRAVFGIFYVTHFEGEVTGDREVAQRMKIRVVGRDNLRQASLDFTPTFLRGRLHMTGNASGFHYKESIPISRTLHSLGYTQVEGVRDDGNQQENAVINYYDQPNKFMQFSRGPSAEEITQQLTYNGGWSNGYSMGPVDYVRFPFAVATKLGMLLHLDV